MKRSLKKIMKNINNRRDSGLYLLLPALLFLLLSHFVIAQEDVLKPGEIVEINVERQKDLSQTLAIKEDGNVTFPLIGEVPAAGLTPSQLAGSIAGQLSIYVKNPKVTVTKLSVSGTVKGVKLTGAVEGILATRVIGLEYADAASLQESLKGVVSQVGKISADPSTNSLIVTDYAANLDGIEGVIGQLDAFGREDRQVLVEAQIVELTNRENEEIGVKWFIPKESRHFAGSFDKAINLPPLPTEVTDSGVSGTTVYETRTAIPNIGLSTLAQGGSFYYGEIIDRLDLHVMLNALNNKGKAKILARPRILVENGHQASIEILTRIPYRELSRTATSAAGDLIFTTSFLDVGVILKVTPYIKRDEIVDLKVEPEVSFVQGQAVDIPIRVSRKASTRVNIKDGYTLVIGGLLQDRDVESVRKLPLLGDIPLLGYLFKFKSSEKEKTELMVFVTPYIMTPDKMDKFSQEGTGRAEEIERPIKEEAKKQRITECLKWARWFYKKESYQAALKEVLKVYDLDKENREAKALENKIRAKLDAAN